MRFLIDGHNLIAHLPDIELSDPHDEAKLVYKLRAFAARTGHKATVVFDGGLPGGISTSLSTSNITVKFASYEQMNADQILMNTLRSIKNVQAYTLVSSDQEIIGTARGLGITTQSAAAFGATIHKAAPSLPANDKDIYIRLSSAEIDEWLAIFSSDDDV